uniref:AT-rich interaction domain 6 n=1 Tax=Salarias fasciatus TaxID=181472 RepID=A0A672IKD0_SALFA
AMEKQDFQERQPKQPIKEMTEEQFLKDLYIFMRKRDTPIERIPHLGFKQIDLFVMFKTVNDLGGYTQVTSQQLWKQVYNTLGGNPRSTSAATCTRRHYEKLLLPYECHMKGIVMSTIPQHQPKPFHYVTYSKSDDCGPRPLKRRMLSLPMHQVCVNLQSPDTHGGLFALPLHYPHFFPPTHTVLPPYVPISPTVMTPHRPSATKPHFPIPPSPLNSDGDTEPLEHLRKLSEWYKTSSGLVQQPLNLSKKMSPQEPSSYPVSSFSPPSSGKNPKFLNKPSTLYTTLHAGAPRDEGSETQEGDPCEGGSTYSYPVKGRESGRDSSSPVYTLPSGSDNDATEMPQTPSSPKTDFVISSKDDREGRSDLKGFNLSHMLPGLPREKEGKMEIEIPLSVFHNWIKLYGPSVQAHKAKEASLSAQEDYLRPRNWIDTDGFNANLTLQLSSQNSAQDLRLRNVPSPTPTTQATGNHHNPGQNHLSSYNALPSGGVPKNAGSRDVYPFDLQDIRKSHNSKSPHLWEARDKEDQSPLSPVKSDGSPHRALPDFVPKLFTEDVTQAARQKSEAGSSAVLMVNSNSLLQLTTEEVMKLKKMISSSS